MVQLSFDFGPKKQATLALVPTPIEEEPPLTVALPTVPPTVASSASYRFPIVTMTEVRRTYTVIWPPPVARSAFLDHRLEEDAFAEELFALGPSAATDEASPETRPLTRAACAAIPRPCPFVSCRHHLFLDVRADGSLKLNFPDKEPDELTVSCSLDLAEDGPRTLDSIAALMGMSKERARQIESEAFDKLYYSLPRAYGTEMSIEEEWV